MEHRRSRAKHSKRYFLQKKCFFFSSLNSAAKLGRRTCEGRKKLFLDFFFTNWQLINSTKIEIQKVVSATVL